MTIIEKISDYIKRHFKYKHSFKIIGVDLDESTILNNFIKDLETNGEKVHRFKIKVDKYFHSHTIKIVCYTTKY